MKQEPYVVQEGRLFILIGGMQQTTQWLYRESLWSVYIFYESFLFPVKEENMNIKICHKSHKKIPHTYKHIIVPGSIPSIKQKQTKPQKSSVSAGWGMWGTAF